LIVAIIVFLIFYFASVLLSRIIRRATKEHRRNLGVVFARLAGAAIVLLGVLVAFSMVAPSFQAGDLIKLLWWDGDGLCLFAKRLERGRFTWPQAANGTVSLTPAQLSMLLEGIDWRRPVRSYAPQMAV